MMISSFNDGSRTVPTAPMIREMRVIIQDLREGRINTNTRFGRKPQWKIDQSKKFIETLLEGSIPVDAISISSVGGIDRCINGNNRMRAILSFANNEFGVEAKESEHDERPYTYYYSAVPEFEATNSRRSRFCKVLPTTVKNVFDRYPMHMNIRNGLTEQEETTWYTTMNKNMKRHTPGQILVTTMCVPDEKSAPFVDSLIVMFPQVKPRISLPVDENDADSVGVRLAEVFDIDIDIIDQHGNDKNEATLLSIACIHNLVVNGHPFDERFKGDFDHDRMISNYHKLFQVFNGIELSYDVLSYFKESASSLKKFLPKIWSPSFLLGPIAWSIATEKDNAVQIWRTFLENSTENLFEVTYITGEGDDRDALTKRRKMTDSSVQKYSIAWERVLQWYASR